MDYRSDSTPQASSSTAGTHALGKIVTCDDVTRKVRVLGPNRSVQHVILHEKQEGLVKYMEPEMLKRLQCGAKAGLVDVYPPGTEASCSCPHYQPSSPSDLNCISCHHYPALPVAFWTDGTTMSRHPWLYHAWWFAIPVWLLVAGLLPVAAMTRLFHSIMYFTIEVFLRLPFRETEKGASRAAAYMAPELRKLASFGFRCGEDRTLVAIPSLLCGDNKALWGCTGMFCGGGQKCPMCTIKSSDFDR